MKILIVLLFFLLTGCVSQPPLKPFSTDGCSLFPDGSVKKHDQWCDCCVVHDLAYWKGGSEKDKEEADQAFRRCVLEQTGDKPLAEFMYQGVKYGGEPFFLNWYRWGYGWDYGRGYRVLSEKERELVDGEMAKLTVDALRCPEF